MKIFCIGLSKTGTTSLASALTELGYRTLDNIGASTYHPGDMGCVERALLDANDAFTDTPIPSIYRQLDQHYPGSKFILTVRDTDAWLKSARKQFTPQHAQQRGDAINHIFDELYGSHSFDEAGFRDGYRRFIDSARQYFADRPDDLLVIDISRKDAWQSLCGFLGRPVPDLPFPKANVTRITWAPATTLLELTERAGDLALEVFNTLHHTRIPGSYATLADALPATVGQLYRRLRHPGCQDPQRAARTARRLVTAQIHAGLRRITPDIPIVTPETRLDAIAEHRNWNHFWLLDPLDGGEHFADPDAIFTINIALIQDRIPITGVIHAPTLGISHYAASWRAPIKNIRGVPLSADASQSGQAAIATLTSREHEALQSLSTPGQSPPISTGLWLYLNALAAGDGARLQHSSEWQTAAAQCLLSHAGVQLDTADDGQPLRYNKARFDNPAIVLRTAAPSPAGDSQ